MSSFSFLRSDLANEKRDALLSDGSQIEGVSFESGVSRGVSYARLQILSPRGAELIGKPCGTYVTLSFDPPRTLSDEGRSSLSSVLGDELFSLMSSKSVDFSAGPVLVVGLGNRRLAVDAVGPAVASEITVTSHLPRLDPDLFRAVGIRSSAAFCPGVLGDTGIETASSVSAVCREISACAVIVVDALAAGSRSRLGCTVQLCDTGVSPGSGVGNDRQALDEKLLGCPVFALGVPTVVDLATLVGETLGNAGFPPDSIPPALDRELSSGKEFFVAPRDIDAAIEELAPIIAAGIDDALRAER